MSKINPKRFPILDADDGQTLGEVGSANGVTIGRGQGQQILFLKLLDVESLLLVDEQDSTC